MTGRGVPQLSVGSSEASLPGLSPTATTTRVRLASGIGRRQLRVGLDAKTTQVETIRVPSHSL